MIVQISIMFSILKQSNIIFKIQKPWCSLTTSFYGKRRNIKEQVLIKERRKRYLFFLFYLSLILKEVTPIRDFIGFINISCANMPGAKEMCFQKVQYSFELIHLQAFQ